MAADLELVFYGQLAAGYDAAQAKQNIAQLFKASVDQIDRMFTGNRVVVRNKLDPDMALKYVIAMKKRGAICQIERMGHPGEKVDLSAISNSAVPESSATPQSSAPVSEPQKSVNAAPTAQSTPAQSSAASVSPANSSAGARKPNNGLQVAGDRVDEILSHVNFELDPVGVRLSEHVEVATPVFSALDDLSIAPVGSDLSDKKESAPVPVPDISHIHLDD